MIFHNLLGSIFHQVVTYLVILSMLGTSTVPVIRRLPEATSAYLGMMQQLGLLQPDPASPVGVNPTLPESMADETGAALPTIGPDGEPVGMLLNADALAFDETEFEPPAVAEPISVARVQSAYATTDAVSDTLVITFTVTNNRPPAVAPPELPATATLTDTLEAVSAFDLSNDPHVVRNVLLTDALLPTNATFVAASPLPDRSGESLAWNLGDVPPLGTLTATLTVQIPSSVPDFVELDTGATAWGTLEGRMVSASTAPASLAPDGYGEWLQWTVDADFYDEYLVQQAAELGNDWQQMFAYVRSLGYESYKGSLRGTRGTLWSEAGNSLDQTSLLIAMLRGSGIPARYRHGTLSTARAQELILSIFPEPTGTIGHIPPGTEVADPANDPQLLEETIDHWWVEAYLPGLGWTNLDPCFAGAAVGQTFHDALFTDGTDQIAEVPDDQRHKVTLTVKVEHYHPLNTGESGLDYSYPLSHTFNTVELVGDPVTLGHFVNSDGASGFVFWNVQHTYIPYLVVGTSDAVIKGDPFQEMLSNFPFGNLIATGEWLLIEVHDVDGNTEYYEREIVDRVGFEVRQHGGTLDIGQDIGTMPMLSFFNTYSMFFAPGDVPVESVDDVGLADLDGLKDDMQTYCSADTETLSESEVAQYEQRCIRTIRRSSMIRGTLINRQFYALSDYDNAALSEMLAARSYPERSRVTIVSQEVSTNSTKLSLDLLDINRRVLLSPGQNKEKAFSFRVAQGMRNTAIESKVLKVRAGDGENAMSFVSAFDVISTALDAGTGLAYITTLTLDDLATLPLSSEAKARITEAVQTGSSVLVPRSMVNYNGTETISWYEIDQEGNTIGVGEDGLHQVAMDFFTMVFEATGTLLDEDVAKVFGFEIGLYVDIAVALEWACNGQESAANLYKEVTEEISTTAYKSYWLVGFVHLTALAGMCTLSAGIADALECIENSGDATEAADAAYEAFMEGLEIGFSFIDMEMFTGLTEEDDPPLPAMLMQHRPAPPPADTTVMLVGLPPTKAETALTAQLDTTGLALASSMGTTARWSNTSNQGQWAFTTLAFDHVQVYAGDSLLDTGAAQVLPLGAVGQLSSDVPSVVTLSGAGTTSFYAPSLSGMGMGNRWGAYTAYLTPTQVATYTLTNVIATVGEMDVYSGDLSFVTSDALVITGTGHTAAPNFADAVSMQAQDAQLTLGPATGTVLVGGQPLDVDNGLALANYTGPVSVTEASATLDQVELDGDADFFTLNLTPESSTTDPNTAVTFDAVIEANVDDTYTVTVEAPEGWDVELDANGTVTAQPPQGTPPGDYTILVTAQSGAHPELFLTAKHTVTTTAYQGMEVDVAPDPLITVPFGPRDPNAFPGDTNSGQVQLPGAAFTVDITNTSTVSHTFEIEVTGLPSGWLILSGDEGQTTTTVTLPAGGAGQVGLYVSPTLQTLPPAGTEYPFSVGITAVDAPALQESDSDVFIVPAIAFNYVTAAPPTVYAAPDDSAGFDLRVKNVGNVTGSFPLTVTLPFTTWTFSAPPAPVSDLPAGETATQEVTFVALGATVGDEGVLRIDSPAPGTAYTQTDYARVRVVGPCVLEARRAADTAGQLDDAPLVDHLENLFFQLDRWERDASNTSLRERTVAALEAVIARLQERHPLVDTGSLEDLATAPTISGFCDPLSDTGDQLERIAQREVAVRLRPGVAATLPGQPVTYTLTLENQGTLTTIYDVSVLGLPTGWPAWEQQSPVLEPGAAVDLPLVVTADALGYRTWGVEVQAAEEPLVQARATAGLNVVDAFVRVLSVNADPAFVETGVSSTTLSVEIANVANVYQEAVAYTQILAPDGSEAWSNSGPLGVLVGAPRTYPLADVETSGWDEGVYTVTLALWDGSGALIPDGAGYSFLGVGQGLRPSHGVHPEVVAPGTVTVTTIITTESTSEPISKSGDAQYVEQVARHTGDAGRTVPGLAAPFGLAPSAVTPETGMTLAAPPAGQSAPLSTLATSGAPREPTAPAFRPASGPGDTGIVRYEEDDPALLYNGEPLTQTGTTWDVASFNWASAGPTAWSEAAGDVVSMTFEGTWVGVGFVTRSNAGHAEVFIDGVSQGVVDTYSRGDDVRSVYYRDLVSGTHVISVTVLGTHNAYASDNRVYLDYIDVWDGTSMPAGDFEQDADRVLLSPSWSERTSSVASGGTYVRNNFGATSNAWFPFTGESVTFQALAYDGAGKVRVLIDGQFVMAADLSSSEDVTRTFSYGSLSDGPHVLQVQQYRGYGTVDAFRTPGSAPFYAPPERTGIVRYEEDDLALLYNGVPFTRTSTTWNMTDFGQASDGYLAWSEAAGDMVSMTFEGTWVGVGFVTRSNAGHAEVFIDGVSQGVVDTYSRGDDVRSVYYRDLVSGTHVISVTVLGTHNAYASDDRIYLDYIDVWDGTSMPAGDFEQDADRVLLSPSWSERTSSVASGGTYVRNNFGATSNAWFPFTGESVTFQALAYSGAGKVRVLIDGQFVMAADLYNSEDVTRTFSYGSLSDGPHVLQVQQYRGYGTVDAFRTPGSAPFYAPPERTGIVRYEEDDLALLYNGVPFTRTSTTWNMTDFGQASDGYLAWSEAAGDVVSMTFEGTWVGVGFVTRSNAGHAEVFIDGVSQGVVDTYSRKRRRAERLLPGLGQRHARHLGDGAGDAQCLRKRRPDLPGLHRRLGWDVDARR